MNVPQVAGKQRASGKPPRHGFIFHNNKGLIGQDPKISLWTRSYLSPTVHGLLAQGLALFLGDKPGEEPPSGGVMQSI